MNAAPPARLAHGWNPALASLPPSGIRKMFNLAASMDDVIHLSIGQPDFPTPGPIVEAHIAALRAAKTRYTLDAGLPELLDALARVYGGDFSSGLTPENFLVTCGASEALFLAITAVASAGREVVVIEPSFINYQPLVEFAGATAVRVVTSAENGHQPDVQAVLDAFSPVTCAIILNSPGNPTGAVYSADTIRTIVAEAGRRGIVVISDEVYERFVFDVPYEPVLRHAESLDHVIVISSVSKTYAMPGLRVGWLISSESNVAELRRYHIFTTTVNNTPAQWAAVEALLGDQSCVAEMAAEYRNRRDLVTELLGQIPQLISYQPQGAFYAMPSLLPGADGMDVAMRLLTEAGVCLVPGEAFGNSCRNSLRISYATSIDQIEKAFERMTQWFARQSF